MTEDEINREMIGLQSAIRIQSAKKKKTQSDFIDIRSMHLRHANLAKKLQEFQRAELIAARKEKQ